MNASESIQQKTTIFNEYLTSQMQQYRSRYSRRFLPFIEAMEYSLEGGGKRFRPLLAMAAADYLAIPNKTILPLALSIEFIHTYSLIHDDLPALDNDDFRRGKLSNHKQFGEAIAILAGDALLTESFYLLTQLSQESFSPKNILSTVEYLAQGAGLKGMVGGQLLDITSDRKEVTLPEVEFIHIHKTGSLILAAVLSPAKLVGAPPEQQEKLKNFGEAIGLAFQIADDLLDLEPNRAGAKKDRDLSYCDFMSPHEAKEKVASLVQKAEQIFVGDSANTEVLIELARQILGRK